MNKNFEFREICNNAELETSFQKRYEAYYNSRQRPLLGDFDGIDLDVYDLHSRHYGIFCAEKMAGYIRIIMPKQAFYNNAVFKIGCKYNIFSEFKHNKRSLKSLNYPPFYFLELYNSSMLFVNGLSPLKDQLEQTVEPSRIVLFDEFKGLALARFLTECALVLYKELCIDENRQALITCFQSHSRFYTSYGFSIAKESLMNPRIPEKLDDLLHLKFADSIETSTIPPEKHVLINAMSAEWTDTRKITRSI